MSSQGFSFPPPPPPPPVSQPHASYPSTRGNGHWNGRGAGGGRGRGRGHGSRGRGGHYSSDATRASYPNVAGYNSTPGNFGYPAQPVPPAPYMNPSHYPHAQNTFQSSPNPPAYPPAQPYSQPAGSAPYHQPLPGYNGPANIAHPAPYPPQSAPAYSPPVPPPQHASPPNVPVMMGSIHWGADAHSSYGAPPHTYGHGHGHGPGPSSGRGHRGAHSHGNHGSKARHPNKRDHASAFHKPQSTAPKVPAPPSVPSFGNPLPCKPPPAADATRKQKKRKRKHNQLGLTPKTEEHESSEEEEDVDEEAKLGAEHAPLQFTYKGRTATLQSSSDIAAWIAERKKKFPTQARIAEKQKAAEEVKAARVAARQEKEQEKEREREKEKEKEKEKEPAKSSPAGRKLSDAQSSGDPVLDAALKAQRKADKIRRTLDREQKRFAKAEAEAEAARLKVEALQKQVQGLKQGQPTGASTELSVASSAASNMEADPEVAGSTETPKEQTSLLATDSHLDGLTLPGGMDDAMDLMSDEDPDGSDWTSSSGSNSEADSESDDSAPEEVSSRREGPERVAPPPREGKKALCRHFARSGQCNRGDQCKFSHEVSERGPKHKSGDKDKNDKKGRKGLFQALLDQQKAEEDKRAMEVIAWLGQHGKLEVTEPNGAPSETPA